MLKRISFYVYVFYCFEVGVFLLLAPWLLPHVWDQNYFVFVYPKLKAVFVSGYFRGAVSGIGVLNIMLAVSEIWRREKNKSEHSQTGNIQSHNGT